MVGMLEICESVNINPAQPLEQLPKVELKKISVPADECLVVKARYPT